MIQEALRSFSINCACLIFSLFRCDELSCAAEPSRCDVVVDGVAVVVVLGDSSANDALERMDEKEGLRVGVEGSRDMKRHRMDRIPTR